MKCYIVFKSGGEYSDYWQQPISVFTNVNHAKAEKMVLNEQLHKLKEKVREIPENLSFADERKIVKEITNGLYEYASAVNDLNDYFIEESELYLDIDKRSE